MKIIYYLVIATGIIVFTNCKDDEPVVKPAVFVEDISRFEGNDGVTNFSFKIKADQTTTVPVTVDYETQSGKAIAGEDFNSKSGTATIDVGARETSVIVEILGDDLFEEDEDFELVISNPNNATIAATAGIGTIRNDDEFVPIDDDGYVTPPAYAGYTTVWADEFDGTTLNTNDWNYETGNSGWGNNELQNYLQGTDNAYISNGKLVIEAKQENAGGSDYTSARITTQGKQFFKYGRVDIRAKLPQGQGIWPALWMLGENFSTVGWPACGEIDIMELVGHQPATTYGTIHWDNNGTKADFGGNTSLSSGIFADEFHVFTIKWNEQTIKWYLDDVLYHTADITPGAMSEFHAPHFFIFNIAVGGNWPGSPDQTTSFPQRMVVDYVRVFQ